MFVSPGISSGLTAHLLHWQLESAHFRMTWEQCIVMHGHIREQTQAYCCEFWSSSSREQTQAYCCKFGSSASRPTRLPISAAVDVETWPNNMTTNSRRHATTWSLSWTTERLKRNALSTALSPLATLRKASKTKRNFTFQSFCQNGRNDKWESMISIIILTPAYVTLWWLAAVA